MTTISERALASMAPLQDYTPPNLRDGRIVSDEDVHSALEYLRNSAHKIGAAAKAEKEAEYKIKTREAFGYEMATGSSDARKAAARTNDDYVAACEEHATAYGEARKLYALREAASQVIEVWRSQSATLRQATKL